MNSSSLILSSDSARLGRDVRTLGRRASAGELRRIRQGVYVPASAWDALPFWDRYPLLIFAAASTLQSRTVFCRQSAAALWGLPLLGRSTVVHACTFDGGGGRSRAGVRRHFVEPDGLEVEEQAGLLVTSRLRTVLDLAAYESFEQAVTVVDHVLSPRPELQPLTKDELVEGVGRSYSAAAARRIRAAGDFADVGSGSPGESVSRALMHRLGFQPPVLQSEIRDARGVVGYTDFEWELERLCGEFDGAVKYQRTEFLQGRTPSEVVIAEKRREDRIRSTGRRVIRWTWTELARPERFAAFLDAERVPRRRLIVRPMTHSGPPRGRTCSAQKAEVAPIMNPPPWVRSAAVSDSGGDSRPPHPGPGTRRSGTVAETRKPRGHGPGTHHLRQWDQAPARYGRVPETMVAVERRRMAPSCS